MVKSFQYPKDLRLFKHEGLAYKFDITFSQKLSKDDLPELYIDIKKILLGAFELKQKTKFTLEEGRLKGSIKKRKWICRSSMRKGVKLANESFTVKISPKKKSSDQNSPHGSVDLESSPEIKDVGLVQKKKPHSLSNISKNNLVYQRKDTTTITEKGDSNERTLQKTTTITRYCNNECTNLNHDLTAKHEKPVILPENSNSTKSVPWFLTDSNPDSEVTIKRRSDPLLRPHLYNVVSENKSNSITKLLNVSDNEEGNNLTDQPCEIKEEKNNEYKDNTQDSNLESSSANSSQNLEESKTSGSSRCIIM